ncbi:FtsX-like permease family protein [Blastopirellula marina]|uniref:FtsX-like permease family protein n=1 Tax=Blastopirellula marina TaxID=124 RepID=UPI001304AA34|nr:ABC transporter permease [Blastopirellula marina]
MTDEIRTKVVAELNQPSDLVGIFPYLLTDNVPFKLSDGNNLFPTGRTVDFVHAVADGNPIVKRLDEATQKRLATSDLVLSHELVKLLKRDDLQPGDTVDIDVRGQSASLKVAGIVSEKDLDGLSFFVSDHCFFGTVLGNSKRYSEVSVTVTDKRVLAALKANRPQKLIDFLIEENLAPAEPEFHPSDFTWKISVGNREAMNGATWKQFLIDIFEILVPAEKNRKFEFACDECDRLNVPTVGPFNIALVSLEHLGDLEPALRGLEGVESIKDYIDRKTVTEKANLDKELRSAILLAIVLCVAIGLLLLLNISTFQYLRFRLQNAEIGLLRAIGFSFYHLFYISACESMIIWLGSIILGYVGGLIFGFGLCFWIYPEEPCPIEGFVDLRGILMLTAGIGGATFLIYMASVLIAVRRYCSISPGLLLRED